MSQWRRPDPYCAFKDDRERRIALSVRNVCACVSVVAVAAMAGPVNWREMVRWLMHWFH